MLEVCRGRPFSLQLYDVAHHLSMEAGEGNNPKEKSWIRKAKKPDPKNRVQKPPGKRQVAAFAEQKAAKEKVESAPNVIVKAASTGETLKSKDVGASLSWILDRI